jgi:hypothetical protein
MKKKIAILLIILVSFITFTSCVTERKCREAYPVQIIHDTKTIIRDSIIELKIHDTVFLKGDTVHDSIPIQVNNNGNIKDISLTRTTDLAMAIASIKSNILYLDLIQKDSLINVLIDKEIKVALKENTITKTIIKKIWVIHWYHKLGLQFSIFVIGLIILLIIIKQVKNLTKIV